MCGSNATVDLSWHVRLQVDEYSHDYRKEKSAVQQIEDGDESLPGQKPRGEEQARAGENDFEGDRVSPRNKNEAGGEEHREPYESRTREPA